MDIDRVNLLITTMDKLRQHGERFRNILVEIDRELLDINSGVVAPVEFKQSAPQPRSIPSGESEAESEVDRR